MTYLANLHISKPLVYRFLWNLPSGEGKGDCSHTHPLQKSQLDEKGKKDNNEYIFFLRNFFNLEIKVLSRGLLENAYIFSYEKETTFEN